MAGGSLQDEGVEKDGLKRGRVNDVCWAIFERRLKKQHWGADRFGRISPWE